MCLTNVLDKFDHKTVRLFVIMNHVEFFTRRLKKFQVVLKGKKIASNHCVANVRIKYSMIIFKFDMEKVD